MSGKRIVLALAALTVLSAACYGGLRYWNRRHAFVPMAHVERIAPQTHRLPPFQEAILRDLDRQVKAQIQYRDGYYEGGDPPANLGVCTDVVIRSFKAAGVDLREEVATDISKHSSSYNVGRPDPNIDHRRCRNLALFFKNHALSLPVSSDCADWQPGDVVFWDTHGDGRIDHVGIIAAGTDAAGNPTIVHHWPGLPVSETDGLFRFRVVGHYRWKDGI